MTASRLSPAAITERRQHTMKVILTEDVPKVGKRGEVVDVKSGYAHNFLFKNNVAVEATKGNLKSSLSSRLRKLKNAPTKKRRLKASLPS